MLALDRRFGRPHGAKLALERRFGRPAGAKLAPERRFRRPDRKKIFRVLPRSEAPTQNFWIDFSTYPRARGSLPSVQASIRAEAVEVKNFEGDLYWCGGWGAYVNLFFLNV